MKIRLNPNRKIYGGSAARLLVPIVFGILSVVTLGAASGPLAGIAAALGTSTGTLAFTLGIVVGSVIAAFAFPVKPPSSTTALPKPSESAVTPSQEGVPIPYVAGTEKTSGIFMWLMNFRSIKTTTTTGGGKGGSDKQKVFAGYEYRATFAMAICLGKCDSLLGIYANEKQVWGGTISNENVKSGSLISGKRYYNKGPSPIITLQGGIDTTIPANTYFTAEDSKWRIPVPSNQGIFAGNIESGFLEVGGFNPRKYLVVATTTAGSYTIQNGGVNYSDGQIFYATSRFYSEISGDGVVLAHVKSGELVPGVKYKVVGYTSITLLSGGTFTDGQFFKAMGVAGQNIGRYSAIGTGVIIEDSPSGTLRMNVISATRSSPLVESDSRRFFNFGYSAVTFKNRTALNGEYITIQRNEVGFLTRGGGTQNKRYTVNAASTRPKATVILVGDAARDLTSHYDPYADFVIGTNQCRIYWGYDDHSAPDSSFLSAIQTPSPNLTYPGICYIIFKDFNMGNTPYLPRLSFEIVRHYGIYDAINYVKDANVPTLRIQAGITYENTGTGVVTYNGNNYSQNQTFVGVSGVTTYSGAGSTRVMEVRTGVPDFSTLDKDRSDVNVVPSMYEMLVSDKLGCAYPVANIDNDSWEESATQLEADGIFLTVFYGSETTVKRALLDITAYLEAILFPSEGLLKLQLLRPSFLDNIPSGSLELGKTYTVYGHTRVEHPLGSGTWYSNFTSFLAIGTTYNAEGPVTGKVIKAVAVDYKKVVGSLRMEKFTNGQVPTEITFSYTNRSKQYKTVIQSKRFNWVFDETSNIVVEGVSLPFVHSSTVAQKVIIRSVRRKGLIVAGATLASTREIHALDPGDALLLVNVDYPTVDPDNTGRNDFFLRVGKFNNKIESDEISLEVTEDIYSSLNTSLGAAIINPDTITPEVLDSVDQFVAFEVPRDLVPTNVNAICDVVLATRTQSIQTGYIGFYAVEDSDFFQGGVSTEWAVYGTLDAGFGLNVEYDTSGSLQIDFSSSFDADVSDYITSIQAASELDMRTGTYLLLINGELMKVVGVEDLGGSIYAFNVIRGCYDTVRIPHSSGEEAFLFLKTSGALLFDPIIDQLDSVVQYKAQAFASDQQEDPTSLETEFVSNVGLYRRPFCPSNFRANAPDLPLSRLSPRYSSTEDIHFEWDERKRGQGSGYGDLEAELQDNPNYTYSDSGFEIDIYIGGKYARTITTKFTLNGSKVNLNSTITNEVRPSAIYDWVDIGDDYTALSKNAATDHIEARLFSVGIDGNNNGLRSNSFESLTITRI